MTRKVRSLPSVGKSSTDSWLSADEKPRRGPRGFLKPTRSHSLLHKHFGGELR